MKQASTHRKRTQYAWYAAGAALLALMGVGYAWYDSRYPRWQEEVRLSDGRVIWIEQKHEYYDNYGTSQSWVTFSLPEMGGKRTWHSYLTPQHVDVYEGKVYVFGIPRGDKQFAFYRNPKHYMVAFQWLGGDFERIPFLQVPPQIRQEENVYSCVPRRSDRPLSLAIKSGKWCAIRGDRWKFHQKISLADYEALARAYAELKNTQPLSD